MPLPFSLPSSLPGSGQAALERILDLCGESLDLLLPQYEKSTRLQALICSFLDAVDKIDEALIALYQTTDPDLAPGKHLDRLGRIVGEDREGRLDPLYALGIKTRILINRSQGRINDLAGIARTFLSLGVNDQVRISEVGKTTHGNRVLLAQNAVPGDTVLVVVSKAGFPSSGSFEAVLDDGGSGSEVVIASGLHPTTDQILLSTPVVGTYLAGPGGVSLRAVQAVYARVEVRVLGTMIQSGADLLKRLRQAKAAGVALTQITMPPFSPLPHSRAFRLIRAFSYPLKNTTQGLSRVADPTSGGTLQHALS